MLKANDSSSIILDGPYLNFNGDQLIIQNIVLKDGVKFVKSDEITYSAKKPPTIQVPTDIPGQTFSVTLQGKHAIEKAEYNKVNKMIILSDIEANFKAFRTLLQGNDVIDDQLNWTFGDGHLVLTGDFFDRGNQLNEVLWLIYSLEEKAKAAKGYVHFILGNHEIMNLNGDLRYVNAKYHQNAQLMNRTYLSLYDKNTELGKWLRTKNIVEKVGPVLCMHGGISSYVNQMAMPLDELNDLVRPYYDDTSYNYPSPRIELLFSNWGPLWYRGYYMGDDKAAQSQIDSTLNIYGVKFIATGHTIVNEEAGVYFNGKVFNTDVPHAKGLSSAILYIDKRFYRVKADGSKEELNKT